jgi:thioredoxin 1
VPSGRVLTDSAIFDAPVRKPQTETSYGMSKKLPMVDESNFEHEVLKSPLPVLLEFGAAWCPPCRAIEPLLEKIAEHHGNGVRVLQIDADDSASIAARYRVRGLPTVITFVGGREHKRHIGATSMDVLLRLLPSDLAATA